MSTRSENRKMFRVGLLVTLSLIVGMVFLFFIGSEQRLFSAKNDYKVLLTTVSGLAEGNPVQLSGVTVGVVRDIRLPRGPENRTVDITISVEKKFSERIRLDSRARLKKLGLIAADSYIDVSPGSPEQPILEPGSIIPSAKQTNVDALITSGEDLVDNMVQISYSMKNILSRVDRGEGLIGELTREPETKQRITDTLLATLNRTNRVLDEVQKGDGLIGRLIYDKGYAASVEASLESVRSVMANVQHSFETGEGALPALLNDPQGRVKVTALIENLRVTSENLSEFSLQLRTGSGLVPRLVRDKEFADEMFGEFQLLVTRLGETARRLNEGEGTAGRLISDPSVYEAINDILIGINESKMLRWLVRSRQEEGIATRYKAAQAPKDTAPPVENQPKGVITPEKPQTPPPNVPPEEPAASPASSTDTEGTTTTLPDPPAF